MKKISTTDSVGYSTLSKLKGKKKKKNQGERNIYESMCVLYDK